MLIFDAVNLIFMALVSIALLMVAFLLMQLKRLLYEQFVWSKKIRTNESITLDLDLRRIYGLVMSEDMHKLNFEALDPEIKKDLIVLLNKFEEIALGINQKLLDEEVVRASIGYAFMAAFSKIKPFLYNIRNESSSPSLYIEFEKLVRNWKDKGFVHHSDFDDMERRMRI